MIDLKLRRNHSAGSDSKSTLIRLILIVLAILFVFAGSVYLFSNLQLNQAESQISLEDASGEVRSYIPSARGDVVHHEHYSLSYLEEHEQAEWVAYLLSRDQLRIPNVSRSDFFNPDPKIKTRSAVHADYINSGYTRGHLAPAGDMAFDRVAMEESFYMSNISPQLRAFNNGVWRELEENVRDWAFSKGVLYVISGPVFRNTVSDKIGKNKVSVPDAFFKVLLFYDGANSKAVGFIVPHALSEMPLSEYMVSVDDVEKVTGIDFFHLMMDDGIEESVESIFQVDEWPLSEKRYLLRVNRWNRE